MLCLNIALTMLPASLSEDVVVVALCFFLKTCKTFKRSMAPDSSLPLYGFRTPMSSGDHQMLRH